MNEALTPDLLRPNRFGRRSPFRRAIYRGGMIAYSPGFREQRRRLASFVDKIRRGAKPADLPIEQPAKFKLVINLKTAKPLGLTVQQSLLARADAVIE